MPHLAIVLEPAFEEPPPWFWEVDSPAAELAPLPVLLARVLEKELELPVPVLLEAAWWDGEGRARSPKH